jgi:hypothetical protein
VSNTRGRQRDLFEGKVVVLDLRPEIRAKLTSLLQGLLTEAAGRKAKAGSPRDGEAGDDQDHA